MGALIAPSANIVSRIAWNSSSLYGSGGSLDDLSSIANVWYASFFSLLQAFCPIALSSSLNNPNLNMVSTAKVGSG
ncbi:unnamed protein product [Prunus armeniaca]